MSRRRVSGAITSTEIAAHGLHAACAAAGLEASCTDAGTHERAHTHTYKQISAQKHNDHTHACQRTTTYTCKDTHTHMPGIPVDDTVCFPHTLFTQHLSLTLSSHALAYTPTHTHAHTAPHTHNTHVDGCLCRRMDTRMSKRRGARGTCCSRPSPIPSLHLLLVGGPPVTAGSLSRPPHHLDAPLRHLTMNCSHSQMWRNNQRLQRSMWLYH
jgi:hypothetical protein